MLTIIFASVALNAATAIQVQEPVVKLERTPAEIEALRTDTNGLTEVTLANGTKMMDLKGRFQMEMRATVGADGKLVLQCNTEEARHEHSSETLAAPANKPEER